MSVGTRAHGDSGLLIGRSRTFREALGKISRYARCSAPVLIEGETGTGKELAARALHAKSDRRAGPFVAINVGALPEALIVNELFGHEQGAFTGAARRCGGLVAQAEGGTLFFDEIDSLPVSVQATLLRFLQEHEYRPLGGGRTREADVRVVSACNGDMAALVRAHKFREDLFYRINVLQLRLPPLRERLGDLEVLTEHFLDLMQERYGGPERRLEPGARAAMARHAWPGNVRELENRVHRAYLLARDARITEDDLDLPKANGASVTELLDDAPFAVAKARLVAAFERDYIRAVLAKTEGNLSAASRLAKKERRAFARLVEKHGIDRREFTHPSY
ncbi:MAG: Fis family transcriptional regulator [Rhodospirillaceae bacterium]|nr:Fis family transcriptional regulator [Rhodospirillaceae bacterium]